jgi:hypothetical protein
MLTDIFKPRFQSTGRGARASALAALVALAAALATTTPAAAQRAPGFNQRLAALTAKARGGRKVRVIATVAGAQAAAGMLQGRGGLVTHARGLGASGIKPLADLPLVAMTVDETALAQLAAQGVVTDIVEDMVLTALRDTTIPLIGADAAHAAGVTGIGLPGQGPIVILDTGVDRTHPELNVIFELCFSTNDPGMGIESICPNGGDEEGGPGAAAPCVAEAAGVDGCDHGTHVAGIAAGAGGVAPGAPIVAMNVFSKFGPNSLAVQTSDLILALNYTGVLETNVYNLAAVNMSLGSFAWGSSSACDGQEPAVTSIINQLSLGMAVVAAAGNNNSTSIVSWPACIASAIAVGNTTDADAVFDDPVFSQGSNAGAPLDLWAPGVGVFSTVPGGIDDKSGTSMSAPHVAGAFALLRQIDPAYTPTQGHALLASTGVPVTDQRAGGTVTRSRIDVFEAARSLSHGRITAQTSDQLGRAMAIGDFNNDGFDDLALGVNQTVANNAEAGTVDVLYGSDIGPGIVQVWTQTDVANQDGSEAGDGFGMAVAAGDFDNDGFDDLAIAAPNEDVDGVTDAGAVHVIYGTPTGLTKTGSNYFNQNSSNIDDSCEFNDKFGLQLAVGSFNNDGFDDLVVGVPYENSGSPEVVDAGQVQVIYGSASGLSPTAAVADQVWHQNTANIEESVEQGDVFGWRLATGDFNADGRDDLAVGVLRESVGAITNGGAVNVIYGSNAGLNATTVADQLWSQDATGITDSAEVDDRFGTALAAADFNGDGLDDLAIGVLNESVGAVAQAGAVHVIYGGGASGLASGGSQQWTQASPNVEETAETADFFGSALAAGDVNNDSIADLAIGARGEAAASGAAQVLHGTFFFGLDPVTFTDQLWTQNSAGISDNAENDDNFGSPLGIGDFNGDGRQDLAVVASQESLFAASQAGLVHVLFQSSSNVLTGTGSVAIQE